MLKPSGSLVWVMKEASWAYLQPARERQAQDARDKTE